MSELELTEKIKAHLSERVQNSELGNKSVIEIIDLLGGYLNAQTISDFAKTKGLSYNGVLKQVESKKVESFELFNVKFVVENY